MEEVHGNFSSSNTTDHELPLGPGFTAFLITASIVLFAIFIVDGLIAITLLQSTSVAVPLRVLLVNILLASLIAIVVSFCSLLNSTVLALTDSIQPSMPFCRFLIWLFFVTLEVRLLGLVAFSVTVLKMVVGSMGKIGAKWLILSLVVTWVIALLTSINKIVPPINGVQYIGEVACFPTQGYPQYRILSLAYLISWIVLALLLPLVLCICIPMAALCYLKRHTISEGAQYKKAMIKFAAFLIIGNILNVLGQLVPVIVAVTLTGVIRVCLVYIIVFLSFIPTPILIVLFLKPVQEQLRHLFCKKWQKNQDCAPCKRN